MKNVLNILLIHIKSDIFYVIKQYVLLCQPLEFF